MAGPTQENDVPLLTYRQIADDLAERIRRGEYSKADPLPSYTELAALYSVSVATAARAYALLKDRGVVVSAAGRGMFLPED
jgi:GntR family transcriptional regulator